VPEDAGDFLLSGLLPPARAAFTNPEDAAFFNRAPQPDELPQVGRAARAWANDLENIPLFLSSAGCVSWRAPLR